MANLYKYKFIFLLLIGVFLTSTAFAPADKIQLISLDMMARTLYDGQSVVGYGSIIYDTRNGKLVTKMNEPYESLTITTSIGEYKSYDVKKNTVMLMQGNEYSSKKSFIYTFLSGQHTDMGLKSLGYIQSNSKVDDGLIITEWKAPENRQVQADKVEIASENYLPIFIGFYDYSGEPIHKSYYTNYQAIGFVQVPMTITEIDYIGDGDSTITQRKYSNMQLNGAVDRTWLDFEIPENAQIIATPQTSTFSN